LFLVQEQVMADNIMARGEPGYTPAPEGQYQAVCADVIDLGERLEQFQGATPKIVRKVAIVFQLSEVNPDTDKPFEPSVEKTLAFGPSAGLRKFLGAWRGKAYTDAEAAAGVPLHRLVGVNAILQVEHKVSASGRTYAKISNIMPPMARMPKLQVRDYERSEHWLQRRADYAQEVQRFRAGLSPLAVTVKAYPGTYAEQIDEAEPERDVRNGSPRWAIAEEPPF
jgi:hypothetical protein